MATKPDSRRTGYASCIIGGEFDRWWPNFGRQERPVWRPTRQGVTMEDQKGMNASSRDRVVATLTELIDALDRRVPHVERVGEIRIAHEAAALKKEALTRIEELTRTASARQMREAAFSNAVMTDDGGPVLKDEPKMFETRLPREAH
jgi:hypothetical protein